MNSLWLCDINNKNFESLNADISVDVCIIGAGIFGLTCGYYLSKAGLNIAIIEKEGYEGDDIIGTISKMAEKQGLEVIILSGDRDTFQLASDKITIHIPRTKMGKTEVDDFDKAKVMETYGIEPHKLIEVKGLMGDTSDNIPGVPGVGEKTALALIQEYGSIENMYHLLEKEEAPTIKGKTREKLLENKELAFLSKQLGTINTRSSFTR